MRACDLLTALSIKTFSDCFTGVYHTTKDSLIPFTNIGITENDALVLYTRPNERPLSIREFDRMLNKHKNKSIVYWTDNTFNPIFGYRDVGGKIVF